jgi:hypothetical protein
VFSSVNTYIMKFLYILNFCEKFVYVVFIFYVFLFFGNVCEVPLFISPKVDQLQGGSNMTGTNCDLFTHK